MLKFINCQYRVRHYDWTFSRTQPRIFQQSTDQQPLTQRKEGLVADSRGASSLGPGFIDTEDKLTSSRIKSVKML